METPWMPWPLIWVVLQLGWRPGWLLETHDRPCSHLTFNPTELTVAEGETATFICNFSNMSERFVLNWYRMSSINQMDKLAAYPEDSSRRDEAPRNTRFHVTRLPNGQDFEMSILTAQLNDSGNYLCGAINLYPETYIHESPCAKLTVTEKVVALPTESPSPQPRPAGQLHTLVIGVTSVLVGVLLLLLLTWVLATAFPRATQGACACCNEDKLLKEGPSTRPVFSVDYGELDFQCREKTPEPTAPCVLEQTEYATIIFPGGPGNWSEKPLSHLGEERSRTQDSDMDLTG